MTNPELSFEEEIELRRKRRRRWLTGIGIALVVAAIAAVPTYRLAKQWRAKRFAAEAIRLIDQGEWQEAFSKAQAAYLLESNRVDSVRAVARLYSVTNPDLALPFWRRLVEGGDATFEDRRRISRLALKLQMLGLADEQIHFLLQEQPSRSEHLLLASELFLLKGDLELATRYARQAVLSDPEDPKASLLLGQLLSQANLPAEREEGKRLLMELSSRDDSVGLQALVQAARLPTLDDASSRLVLKRLGSHPLADAEHETLLLKMRLNIGPAENPDWLRELLANYKSGSAEKKLAVGRWLNQNRRYRDTLDLIGEPEALKSQETFLARADALAALDRWEELLALLENPAAPVKGFLKSLFLARAYSELGQQGKADVEWRRVYLEVDRNPQALLYLGRYARSMGQAAYAEQAYRKLTLSPEFARRAYFSLIQLAEADKNTLLLRELLKEICAVFPEDSAPKNDLAYVNLLMNENVAAAKETAAELVRERPSYLAYRVTLALARLRSNEPQAAAQLLDGLDVNWSEVLPGWQSVRAAVAGATGKPDLARALARQIPLERLKNEERALIQPWL